MEVDRRPAVKQKQKSRSCTGFKTITKMKKKRKEKNCGAAAPQKNEIKRSDCKTLHSVSTPWWADEAAARSFVINLFLFDYMQLQSDAPHMLLREVQRFQAKQWWPA